MRPPARHLVLRDLKRGLVEIKHGKDLEEAKVTLLNQYIPDAMMKESNPNHPLEADLVLAWDVSRYRWYEFNASEIKEYHPPYGDNSGQVKQERTTSGDSPERTGDRTTEAVQREEETQADDRGTEGQGEGEPSEGTGRTWSSKV